MCFLSVITAHYSEGFQELLNQQIKANLDKNRFDLEYYHNARKAIEQSAKDCNKLLKAAHEYDIKMNQPYCESDEKKAQLLSLADKLGIKIEFPE